MANQTIDIPHVEIPTNGQHKEPNPDIIVLKFADAKIPVFKESRNKDYIRYGDKNNYPEYLTYLFNKSAKHNAILTGKAFYVFGNGYANGNFIANRLGESLNDISKKAILDVEVYGGFRFEIIYNAMGQIAEIYHVDYSTIRKGKEQGYYYKECWNIADSFGGVRDNLHETEQFIPGFNPSNPSGSQIYAYDEYRPMVRFYPLPSYIGCNNYIETDIEISKYYLSAIRNGMMPSKMVQFYQGEPSEDKKREIEARFQRKFSGAENAGKFILVFNNGKDKQVDVSDLSASEVDKQFVELNKTCQQEIFSGHLVTSPLLFGIKTEGQLGGNTELYTAYNIFQNTYATPKSQSFDKEINYLLGYSKFKGVYNLQPTDPIGIQFDVKDVVNSLPKAFVFDKLGIPKELWDTENIGADNRPTPTTPIAPLPQVPVNTPGTNTPASALASNDNIKNLTAKQHQQLLRIIRQYTKKQLTEAAAKTLLRTGLGLSDEDINSVLGIQVTMSADQKLDDVIAVFDAYGDSKDDYEILRSKKVVFTSDLEMEADEDIFIKEAFKTYDVTLTEEKILELIRKDKRITPEVIAGAIGQSKAYVEAKIDNLTKRGYIESITSVIGPDEIIERSVKEDISIPPPPVGKTNPAQIFIKYSYEVKRGAGPTLIPTSRPFCIKMIGLNRLYSRAEIEQISSRLGYSVFDRKGGWWGDSPECRHRWESHILVQKREIK
jgi:DNA-binding Lrp family transcriptional regulator